MVWLSLLILAALGVAYWGRKKLHTMLSSKAWQWPVPGHTRISSPFGGRVHPITGAHKHHNGIDIPAPVGTMVVAPYGGRVDRVFATDAGGKQLTIVHDDGRVSGYAHLHAVLVDPGERVTRGEPIAQVGNTGASTGPHLHFTVRPSAQLAQVDPQTLYA